MRVIGSIDVANVQNILYNLKKERVLLRSFQYYFQRTFANKIFVICLTLFV